MRTFRCKIIIVIIKIQHEKLTIILCKTYPLSSLWKLHLFHCFLRIWNYYSWLETMQSIFIRSIYRLYKDRNIQKLVLCLDRMKQQTVPNLVEIFLLNQEKIKMIQKICLLPNIFLKNSKVLECNHLSFFHIKFLLIQDCLVHYHIFYETRWPKTHNHLPDKVV